MKAGDVKISAVQRVGRGKILVIDEDAKDLEAYSSCLRREGYEVVPWSPTRRLYPALDPDTLISSW